MQRATQIRRPWSSVRSMPQTCTVRPLRIGVAVAVSVPSLIERRCEQLSSVPTTIWSGPTLDRPADRRGALGEQRRDAAVQDAVGLVDLRSDLDAQDDLLGRDEHRSRCRAASLTFGRICETTAGVSSLIATV